MTRRVSLRHLREFQQAHASHVAPDPLASLLIQASMLGDIQALLDDTESALGIDLPQAFIDELNLTRIEARRAYRFHKMALLVECQRWIETGGGL